MTHDILQSDIELAIRLRDERRPDEEIIRALVHRRVDPAQAAQLLEDLRNGRKVDAPGPMPAEFSLRRRKRIERPRPEAASSPAPTPRSSPPPRRGARNARGAKIVRWFFLVPVGVVLLVLGAILLERHYNATRATADSKPPLKDGIAALQKQRRANAVAAPALELQPDGLRIGGQLVTQDNVLATVAGVLGAPSRTNRVAESGATIYAFDQVGVLVYVQPAGRTNSVMLDCDATGGAHGTALPFAGTLKIGDEIIGPEVDAQMLARLKPLALSSTRSDGSIWGGRYGVLELVFAYLKTPQRLSLIEIDLN